MTKGTYIQLLEKKNFILIAYMSYMEEVLKTGTEPLDYSIFEGIFDIEGDKMQSILKEYDEKLGVKRVKEVTVDITITEEIKYI